MVARKRNQQEMEEDIAHEEPSMILRLRNMWEFASLMQYIQLFGKVVKIDDNLDIDELEALCINTPNSVKLLEVGLALLKFVSSHRGLTPDLFNEYTRRQYQSKKPRQNPFGDNEVPNDFSHFDIYTKIRVLHHLSVWTLNNPDKIRERLPGKEYDQTQWRMEPLGRDGEGRIYYVLDDNRLYRRTDPPISPKTSKSQTKKSSGTSNQKRRKTLTGAKIDGDETNSDSNRDQAQNHDYDGMKWECIAITLDDYTAFMQSIRRSRGQEEKALHLRLVKQVMPVIERRAEEQRRKATKRQKELENMEKLATAKRSSRIAGKMERKKQQEDAEETERKRAADLANAKREERRLRELGDARESRIITREQRLKEREMKQILHEEELHKLEQSKLNVENGGNRMSERNYEAEMRKRQDELEQLKEKEKRILDCLICGSYGDNYDNELHSIACESCNVWQHSECHGFSREDADKDDFKFRCAHCKEEAEDIDRPKIAPIKIHLGKHSSPRGSKASEPDVPSQAAPEEQTSVYRTLHLQNKRDIYDGQMTDAGELDRPPIGPDPENSSDHKWPESEIPPRTPLNLPTDNAAAITGQLLKSGNSNIFHNKSASILSNGSSVAALLVDQKPHNEPNHNNSVTNGFYKPSIHSSNESQQPTSSPAGKLNGHSSPVRLPPPEIPNGNPDAHFKSTGDSPIKHAPTSVTQTPAEIITGVISGFSPTKHDSPRPSSSCSISRTQVIPPITNLSPKADATILTPPSKKLVSSPPAQAIVSPHVSQG